MKEFSKMDRNIATYLLNILSYIIYNIYDIWKYYCILSVGNPYSIIQCLKNKYFSSLVPILPLNANHETHNHYISYYKNKKLYTLLVYHEQTTVD